MKSASISEIRQELNNTSAKDLLTLCLRMAKYKKENKELLSFLLFESNDIQQFIISIKNNIDDEIKNVNKANLYLAKKGLRKILRITNKYIKYTDSNEVAVELIIYFCSAVKSADFKIHKSVALSNLYKAQLKKIDNLIKNFHDDLKYDFLKQAEQLLI